MKAKRKPGTVQDRAVRVTLDFVILFDKPQDRLPAGLLPGMGDIMRFIANGCSDAGIRDAVIQDRAKVHVRFVPMPKAKP